MVSITNDEYNSLVEARLAGLISLKPAILEKDLLVTRALRLLSDFDWNLFSIVFCGGTSLSKGYGIIDRMSEDIDFKVQIPPQWTRSKSRKELKFLFWKVVASDQQRFGGPDRALADRLVRKLDSALRKLKTDALPFQEQYKLFVGELVWGQTVDFEEARAAFSQLAEELIRSYCVENGLEREQ